MAKYIRCGCCGKRIDFGNTIYKLSGYCGLYCSAECFASEYATEKELNEDVADNCCTDVYDDEEDKRKLQADIANAEREIAELQRKLELNKTRLTQYE